MSKISSLTLYHTSLQSARLMINHQQSVLTDSPYMKKSVYNVLSTNMFLPFAYLISSCKQKQKDSLCIIIMIMIIHSFSIYSFSHWS